MIFTMESLYLHLEQDSVILKKNIIGIFDMDKTTVSKKTREYLNQAEREGRVRYVSYDLPKSFIICAEGNTTLVYISRLSSETVRGRMDSFS